MKNYNNSSNPEFLNNYLVHIKVVKMLSERTIEEYYLDTRLFLKYYYNMHHDNCDEIESVDISGMTESELRKVTVSDIFIDLSPLQPTNVPWRIVVIPSGMLIEDSLLQYWKA